MMADVRLIDANKLERRLIEGDGHDDNRFTEGYNFAINEVRGYIADMPTVEASPCEFCKYDGCGNPCIACPATAKEDKDE